MKKISRREVGWQANIIQRRKKTRNEYHVVLGDHLFPETYRTVTCAMQALGRVLCSSGSQQLAFLDTCELIEWTD